MFWLFMYVFIFGAVGVFQVVIFISINAVALKGWSYQDLVDA